MNTTSSIPKTKSSSRRPNPWQSLGWSKPQTRAPEKLLAWFDRHRRSLPWRERFAQSGDPYHVWVSEIMLQQTVIKAVVPVYERFLRQFPTIVDLAAASEDDVRQAVRGLGYYRRFRMLHQAAQQLTTQWQQTGEETWPITAAAWRDLPGIGEYTSAAVASIAFGDRAGVVDGNVERVFCRWLDLEVALDAAGLKKAFGRLAQDLVPADRPGDYNEALMELGQRVCTPTNPDCEACPVQDGCLASASGRAGCIPLPKQKRPMIDVPLTLLTAQKGRKFALVKRPVTAKFLKETWGFATLRRQDNDPNADWQGDGFQAQSVGDCLQQAQPLAKQVKHGITNHRLQVRVVTCDPQLLAQLWSASPASDWQWVDQEQVEAMLVSNLDRKAWHLIEKQLS